MNNIHLYKNDVPSDINWGRSIAIDTETTGLNVFRDRLCLVQIGCENGDVHIVQFSLQDNFDCPNLKSLLANASVLKIFHFARFDVMFIHKFLNISTDSVYCTKIASKLCRTYTDKHGLKDLVKELLNIDLEKEQQSSYWGAEVLNSKQLDYAAKDVIYLHQLKNLLDQQLKRENRFELAQSCFNFISTRAKLDLLGLDKEDIFTH